MSQAKSSNTVSAWYSYCRLALGLLIALLLLFRLEKPPERKFDEFGLSRGTSGYRAAFQGRPVNATGDSASVDEMLEGRRERGSRPFALLLGNSQLDSINQRKGSEDRNAPDLLFDARDRIGMEILTINLPNGTLGEFLVLADYVISRQRPEKLVVAACFDDTREGPPRDSVARFMADPATADALSQGPAGRLLLETTLAHDTTRNTAQKIASDDTAGLAGSAQQWVEARLNEALAEAIPLWRNRPTMRGRLSIGLLKTRNWLLGISPQSKRPVIPPRYAQHMGCLAELIKECGRKGIECIVYIPPLRNDVDTPYIPEQYAAFKFDVETLCKRHGASFFNFENLVPGEFWGLKPSMSGAGLELDFMHFQGPGHVLLANAFEELLSKRSPTSGN